MSRLISGARALAHEALMARVVQAAGGFRGLGIGDGGAVALLLRNDFAFFEATMAAGLCGAYATPINWHFTADEAGYILRDSGAAATGGPAQRISFGEGQHSTPVWSPRGDYIAFTGQARGQFSIGILKPDGSGERVLVESFHNEGPTFAPNGRVIMYFSDPGPGPSLYTIDITGRNQLKVPTPSYASDPAWSPLLS